MSEFATGWLDTNMILRYLLGEPQDQAQAAASIIEQSSLVAISPVILAESFFILFTVYRRSRADIVDSLAGLVNRENVQVSHIEKALVIDALYMCRDSGRVKVADALLWAEARTAGPATIYTFDRRFPDQGVTLSEAL
ncbi:MAG: PIN domain-containing protein [Caldilineaceae bacterium]|nr:PIN domain-containing protein [Caldilineaceae bacterium]HRW46843.1 PIN domain-containing protein [Caldilinea sp.]